MNQARKDKLSLNTHHHFWWILNSVLLVVIIFSAFLLVYLSDLSRRNFIRYQSLLQESAQLRVAHNKLLLEESTWASDARIQRQAMNQLKMLVPQTSEIIVVPNDDSDQAVNFKYGS